MSDSRRSGLRRWHRRKTLDLIDRIDAADPIVNAVNEVNSVLKKRLGLDDPILEAS
jgi:hypothetical protein